MKIRLMLGLAIACALTAGQPASAQTCKELMLSSLGGGDAARRAGVDPEWASMAGVARDNGLDATQRAIEAQQTLKDLDAVQAFVAPDNQHAQAAIEIIRAKLKRDMIDALTMAAREADLIASSAQTQCERRGLALDQPVNDPPKSEAPPGGWPAMKPRDSGDDGGDDAGALAAGVAIDALAGSSGGGRGGHHGGGEGGRHHPGCVIP